MFLPTLLTFFSLNGLILNRFRGKINHLTSQYRYAHQALLALDPQKQFVPTWKQFVPTWKQYFLELAINDLHAPMCDKGQPSDQPSEG